MFNNQESVLYSIKRKHLKSFFVVMVKPYLEETIFSQTWKMIALTEKFITSK